VDVHRRLIMDYDYWSTGAVHRATIWASAQLVVGLQQSRDPLGYSAPWQAFAAWVQIHARSLQACDGTQHPNVLPRSGLQHIAETAADGFA
jgi:hypothetical protein